MSRAYLMLVIPRVLRALMVVTVPSAFLFAASSTYPSTPIHEPPPSVSSLESAVYLREAFGRLPLSFEANKGQVDDQVQFLARGTGYTLFLTQAEAVLALTSEKSETGEKGEKSDAKGERAVVRMKLVGANPSPRASGVEPQPGIVNYFLGNDLEKWRANIPTYAKVEYEQVYPGIDVIYYGTKQQQLEYDFVVAPGADPKQIALTFEGTEKVEIDAQGDLVLSLSESPSVQCLRPAALQEADHLSNGRWPPP